MAGHWEEVYYKLQDYIAANPDIELSQYFTVIPSELREHFYKLFDDVKYAFLQDKFAAEVKEAENLGRNFVKAEQDAIKLLQLEGIYLLEPLDRFLRQPKDSLTRELIDPLFDLLKRRITAERFEAIGIPAISKKYEENFSLGYTKWVALSMINMLDADRLFNVTPPESKLTPHGEPRHFEKPVSLPEECNFISFEHGPDLYPPFIVPHFVIHSAKLNRYVSVRSELIKRAEYTAEDASQDKQWLPFESFEQEYLLTARNPALLVYLGDKPETLALVADRYRVMRPDLIIECGIPEDWTNEEKLADTRFYDVLNPVLGRFKVSSRPGPEQLSQNKTTELLPSEPLTVQSPEKEKIVAVHHLTVAFNQNNLEPIIDAMTKYVSPTVSGADQAKPETGRFLQYYPD